MASEWTQYYDAAGDDPRPTLLDALRRFDDEEPGERFAVDLGSGSGRDTAELLRRGWSVLAVDATAEAIERLLSRPDLSGQGAMPAGDAGLAVRGRRLAERRPRQLELRAAVLPAEGVP